MAGGIHRYQEERATAIATKEVTLENTCLRTPPALVEINISPEKVCYIIVKPREFDAKVEPVEPDPASNPSDDADHEILED